VRPRNNDPKRSQGRITASSAAPVNPPLLPELLTLPSSASCDVARAARQCAA
jgi:hypothetical protein